MCIFSESCGLLTVNADLTSTLEGPSVAADTLCGEAFDCFIIVVELEELPFCH